MQNLSPTCRASPQCPDRFLPSLARECTSYVYKQKHVDIFDKVVHTDIVDVHLELRHSAKIFALSAPTTFAR